MCFTVVSRRFLRESLFCRLSGGIEFIFASNIKGRGCRLPVFTGNLQGRRAGGVIPGLAAGESPESKNISEDGALGFRPAASPRPE
jgi:hypothetical protein